MCEGLSAPAPGRGSAAHLGHHHAHVISSLTSTSSCRSAGGRQVRWELAAATGRGEARAGAAGSVGTPGGLVELGCKGSTCGLFSCLGGAGSSVSNCGQARCYIWENANEV